MTRRLTADGYFLFITRIARMFGYGFLSVVLVLYLTQVGLSETADRSLADLDLDWRYRHLLMDYHQCGSYWQASDAYRRGLPHGFRRRFIRRDTQFYIPFDCGHYRGHQPKWL